MEQVCFACFATTDLRDWAAPVTGTESRLLSPSGTVTVERQEFGKCGEDRAADELEHRGYAILARRYRTKHGEIDIVARDGDTTVFVEVKARATAEFGTAAEAVTRYKQRQVVSMAWDYVVRNDLTESRCRFDVVAIDGVGEAAVITVYPNAFEA